MKKPQIEMEMHGEQSGKITIRYEYSRTMNNNNYFNKELCEKIFKAKPSFWALATKDNLDISLTSDFREPAVQILQPIYTNDGSSAHYYIFYTSNCNALENNGSATITFKGYCVFIEAEHKNISDFVSNLTTLAENKLNEFETILMALKNELVC